MNEFDFLWDQTKTHGGDQTFVNCHSLIWESHPDGQDNHLDLSLALVFRVWQLGCTSKSATNFSLSVPYIVHFNLINSSNKDFKIKEKCVEAQLTCFV